MKRIIEALRTRHKYNAMPFDEFIKEYEDFFGEKVTEYEKRTWKNTGLNNTDFLIVSKKV